METVIHHQPQPSNGQNGHAACASKKKPHASEADASAFEAAHREDYGKQYAYACEECPAWHLTATPPGTPKAPYHSALSSLRTRAEIVAECVELRGQGVSVKDIAVRRRMSTVTVYAYLREANGAPSRTHRAKEPLSLDDYAAAKKSLQDQLEKLLQDEARMIERKALKLTPCKDGWGILIQKEGNTLALSLDDCNLLVDKLTRTLEEATK